jgi:hypothetical protein
LASPLIFIHSFAFEEGRLDDLRKHLPEFLAVIEANEPRLLAIHAYVNDEGTELTFVQVHADADSLEHHQRVVHQHAGRQFAQLVDATTKLQIYGTPSDVILKRARQHATSGVAVTVNAEHLGGFARLADVPISRLETPTR